MPERVEWALVVHEHDTIGEGPVWDAPRASLLWTDIGGRRIHRLDPATGAVWTRGLEQMAGAVLPRASGGLALCLQDGVYLTDTDEGEPRLLVAVEPDDEVTRLNDVKTDRTGRLWGGTMAFDARPDAGAFYRIEPDGTIATIASPTSISNGIEWSLDGSLMYYIDTATGRMDVFDFDLAAGSALNRRPFIVFDESFGIPDGMTIDAEGCPWVAFYDGWAVRRFTPSGALDRTIELPTARTTSCAFGGPDLDHLFVTSARDGLSEAELAEQPHAGALFVIEPGVTGLPITPFAG
ncbi:MAG: SMP-30/gluconolactonase/LRE family protein [Chloroflexota bacterium]|nr:SMP-30/gluconolactonase/LRE family protein [Chloroflexota bacterium]